MTTATATAYLISLEYDGQVKDEQWLTAEEFREEFIDHEREALTWRFEKGIPASISRCGGAFTFTLKEIAQ